MSVTCLVLHEPFVVLVCSNVVVVSCLLLIWYYVGYLWYCMSLSLRPFQLHISLPYYCTSHTLLPIFLPILPYKWYNPHITTQHKRYTTTQIIQSSSYYTDETLLLLLSSTLASCSDEPLIVSRFKFASVARASFDSSTYKDFFKKTKNCVGCQGVLWVPPIYTAPPV